ncbi:DUF1007 family protein [Marinimicrococcus flavescens]|uniref:DUF1007 family protein n=1 Tax=Marinimicrococcus flavescens TaxID=3031815 RepID=A0AAP3XQD1_9PROT|nr:DUF1007 family protein [Marinimicrococcus flavescens]
MARLRTIPPPPGALQAPAGEKAPTTPRLRARRSAGARAATASAPLAAALIAACLCVVAAPPARAHPHGWIDVTVSVLFDRSGKACGLRQHWLFDEFYSTFATEGLAPSGEEQALQDGIDALMRENMTNLAEFGYFTRVVRAGADVTFGPVAEMAASMHGQRLGMSFVLPFSAPLDLAAAPLTYAIFDPTYYIEMLHAETKGAISLEDAPPGCTFAMETPNPDADWVALASSLDRNQSAGDGLGAVFAEKVTVACE